MDSKVGPSLTFKREDARSITKTSIVAKNVDGDNYDGL